MNIYTGITDNLKGRVLASLKVSSSSSRGYRMTSSLVTLATYCRYLYFFSASFNLRMAFPGSFSSSSKVTNLLPIIAPEACSQAA